MPRPTLKLLSEDEVARIHEASLWVLERVGVKVLHEEGLSLLRGGGSEVDVRKGIVEIPASLVEEALKIAPKTITLYGRGKGANLSLGGERVHFDPGSAAPQILDYGSAKPRNATLRDLRAFVTVADALPHIDAQSTALIPSDLPIPLRDRARLYVALKFSSKPVVTGAFTEDGVTEMARMNEIVSGDVANKPMAIFDICPSPPLTWSRISTQNLLDCAQLGLPVELVPMPLLGATSPLSLAGALVQHHAEALSGIVLSQLARKGSPVIYGGSPCLFEMKHATANITTPETSLISTAYLEVAKSFSLPTHAYLGLSDSKTPDYQAGVEASTTALVAVLKGVNVVSGAGMLEFESVQSLEKLVMDHDAIEYALRFAEGFDLDPESLALTEIAEVGAGGHFLTHPQTLKRLRSGAYQPPRVFDRAQSRASEIWLRAKGVVDAILRGHKSEPLPPDVEKELDEYMLSLLRRAGVDKLPLEVTRREL